MNPKPGTAVAPVSPREAPGTQPKGGRFAGCLLVLTAGQALAGAVTSGWGEDELYGTNREDRLAGFGGDDGIWGLARDDFIEAKDGARDYVECGPGTDIASVDARDLVARTCETVYTG